MTWMPSTVLYCLITKKEVHKHFIASMSWIAVIWNHTQGRAWIRLSAERNSAWTCQKTTLFSGHYLRNRSTLDIGVLGYIGILNIRNTLPKFGTFLLGHPVYLVNVIDIFSRYTWSMPLKAKTANSITTALKYLFQNRKPITTQSVKGTGFVNATVQQYLKRQEANFHTTHNHDIKGAIIERFNRTLKTRMYKYFTKNNTYRYLDVMIKLLTSYNSFAHSTTGMSSSKVNPSNIYSVWQKMNSLRAKIPEGRAIFKVRDLVRITKEKVKFAKGNEQTFSTEIFRVVKVIQRLPHLFTNSTYRGTV